MLTNRTPLSSAGSTHQRTRVALLAIVCGLCVVAKPLTAQTRDIIVSGLDSLGEACRIELEHVVTIGSAEDEHLYGMTSLLVVGPGSSYYIANSFTPGVVLVYDSTGGFSRKIGRLGPGPGEISGSALIHVTSEDTLLVASNGRVTHFSTTGVAERSWNYEMPLRGITGLQDGIIIATLGPNNNQETVRILNADGSTRASIFFDGLLQHRDQMDQRAFQAGNAQFLVSDAGRYRIRAFNPDGHLKWIVRREVDWFQPYARQPPLAMISTPSLPAIVGAWVESNRHLWVLLERPSEDWRPVERPLPRPSDLDFNNLVGSHLEVIDLQTEKVVASCRTQWLLPLGGDQPLMYSARYAETGHVVFDVWRSKFIQSSGRSIP